MADLMRIVGATIAIAVRDTERDVQIGKCDCDRNHSRSDNCRLHRNRWSSRRVLRNPGSRYHHDDRWSPHGGGQAHQLQILMIQRV